MKNKFRYNEPKEVVVTYSDDEYGLFTTACPEGMHHKAPMGNVMVGSYSCVTCSFFQGLKREETELYVLCGGNPYVDK